MTGSACYCPGRRACYCPEPEYSARSGPVHSRIPWSCHTLSNPTILAQKWIEQYLPGSFLRATRMTASFLRATRLLLLLSGTGIHCKKRDIERSDKWLNNFNLSSSSDVPKDWFNHYKLDKYILGYNVLQKLILITLLRTNSQRKCQWIFLMLNCNPEPVYL